MKSKKITYASAIILMGFIILMGICADKNLFDFSVLGIKASNYEFSDDDGNSAELDYAVNFPLKTSFVDLNGAIRKLFHQHEMNGVTKLNNGYLTVLQGRLPIKSLDKYSDALKYYSDWCEKRGTKLLFVQPPYTDSKYDPELPCGDVDYSNDNMDYLLNSLRKKNIAVIDLRECMHEDGINQYDYSYRTDHHWNAKGGFYAYTKIVDWITKYTGCEVDKRLTDIDNYQIKKYPQWHLGSRGLYTGRYYAGIDDYYLILPNFKTCIINSKDGTKGSFADQIVNWSVFSDRDAIKRYTYETALSKNDINCMTSENAKSDISVYMISDSFATAIDPYMLLTYRDYNKGALRYPDEAFAGSKQSKINPDVVVIMPYYENYCKINMSEIITSLNDK